MKQEYDITRNADRHRRGKVLDDVLAFLNAWSSPCRRSTPTCVRSRRTGHPSGSAVPARPRCAGSAAFGVIADTVQRYAESGVDEAFFDAFGVHQP
jgi:hypothetical protein